MGDTDNVAASGLDRVQRLAGTAIFVGVIPWMLAAGQLVLSDGLRIAFREMVASPMLWLPVVAVLLFAAVHRAVSSAGVDPVLCALIVASAVCAGVLGLLLLVGNTTFGADGLWFYVRLTAYLPLVTVAAGVRASSPPRARPAHRTPLMDPEPHPKRPD